VVSVPDKEKTEGENPSGREPLIYLRDGPTRVEFSISPQTQFG
jgi:hypothetical protein